LKDSSLKRDVFYLLGVVYENLGFTEDAESYFVRLLKEKEDERVLFHLARIYLKTGRLKEAEENVKKILFKGKEYIDVLILFARIKELQGNFQEVLFALRKILKKGKISVKIIKWIGEILENLKRYDAAIKEYRLALQKFPDDEELLYSLGRCLWKSGKSKELEKVKKELERLGKEEYVKLLTALELTSKEEYSLAIPLFKSLAGKFYFKEELHYYLGVCYALEGEYEKAIKSWSRVLKISPFSILGKKAKDYIDLALKWIKALEKGVKE
jgi:tetratricopeptide (TPR) repeat protein